MSKTIELARHLETLHINDMYKTDFYWTWDKTDEEIDAVFTVADALRDLRERNICLPSPASLITIRSRPPQASPSRSFSGSVNSRYAFPFSILVVIPRSSRMAASFLYKSRS